MTVSNSSKVNKFECPIKARFRLAGVQLLNQYISTPFLQERKLTVDARFHNFDKIPAKKLRPVKVEQLTFLV